MLTLKNKVKVIKLNNLIRKRNEAYAKGDFAQAAYYGKLVDEYITNVLKMEGV